MDVEPEEYQSSLQFEIAIGRERRSGEERRVAVEAVWRAMADGQGDLREREEWLSYVAKRIVSDVLDDPRVTERGKGSSALMALGLYGRRVADSELLEALKTLMEFADLFQPRRELSHRDEVQLLRPAGHFEGMSDAAAVKKIQNLLQNRT